MTGGKKPYTYQWLADGTAIADADGETLAITEDMVGKKISVKITDLEGTVKTSEATAAVVKDLPELENVIQYSSNQITLFFDTDASSIGADDIEVAREEDLLDNPVEKVELIDPTTIRATLSSTLVNEKDYLVTVGDVTTSFTASVGEVAAVRINTTQAEVNKPTKIEYQLLDEKGIDVTATQKLKETVLVDITGTYKTAKTSDPTDVSVTMGTVDDECEVTITYSTGDGDDEQISDTKKIICVGPTAEKGTIKYVKTNDVNKNSGCARFYLDGVGTAGTVSIEVGEDTETTGKPVYFAAFDDNGAAISYDQYEVESANEKIVASKVDNAHDSGKFAVIQLVGNEVGTTQVKVIATNNTVSKEYFINVTVKDKEDMVKITLKDSRNRVISNAYDVDYNDKITATIVDDNGDAAKYETIAWELANQENYKSDDAAAAAGFGGVFAFDDEYEHDLVAADKFKETERYVEAWGAKSGSYTVKAKVDLGDVVKEQNITISVKSLPSKAWNTGVKLDYDVDVASASMDNFNASNKIRLSAMINGLFAGYVRQNNANLEIADELTGAVKINAGFTMPANAASFSVNASTATYAAVAANDVAGIVDGDIGEGKDYETVADIPKTIKIYDADGATLGTYKLTRVAQDDYNALIFDNDEIGAYWYAEEGDVLVDPGEGEVTVGSDGNGHSTTQVIGDSVIADGTILWTIKYGNKPLATEALYGFLEAILPDQIGFFDDEIEVKSDRKKGNELGGRTYLTYVANDNYYDYDFARPGRYTVEFTYVLNLNSPVITLDIF